MREVGAQTPPARVPRTVWQAPQRRTNATSPLRACSLTGGGETRSCAVPPALEGIRRIGDDGERHVGVLDAAIFSALPAIGAGLVGLDPGFVHCPGMTSVLPESAGTQNEWMTSALCSRMRTGTPTGMWISLAVVNWRHGMAWS